MNYSSTIIKKESPSKPNLHKCTEILEEMGFGTIEPPKKKLIRKLSRRSSIGLSDFWSFSEKEKFLRKNMMK